MHSVGFPDRDPGDATIRAREAVRALAASPRHGATSRGAHARAAGLIEAWLREVGCTVSRQEFMMPAEAGGRAGVNVVGVMPGREPEMPAVVVGAHYDTRPNSPGADDNASGVAAMIECARAVAGRGLRRSVIFVAFDAEERQDPARGLWGSDAFVSGFMKKRGGGDPWNTAGLSAALILEMVGYSAPKGRQRVPLAMRLLFPAAGWRVMRRGYAGDFLVAVTRGRGKNVAQTLSKRSSQAGGPPVLALGLPGWAPIPPDLLRSDHAAFWLAGVPAVMIGDTANFRNPNYHLPSDTPETLDYVMIAGIASALAETVAELANQA